MCWSLGLSVPEGDSENLISRRVDFSVPNMFFVCVFSCVCRPALSLSADYQSQMSRLQAPRPSGALLAAFEANITV